MLLHRNVLLTLISATSVDVERAFSQERLLLSHVRSRLSVQLTRASMCLGAWSLRGFVKDSDIKAVTVLLGCNTGYTVGDFVLHRTCHLSHRTRYRCGVHRYRFELRVWLRHCGINIPRYTADTTVYY